MARAALTVLISDCSEEASRMLGEHEIAGSIPASPTRDRVRKLVYGRPARRGSLVIMSGTLDILEDLGPSCARRI